MNITATRTATTIDIHVDGVLVDTLTGKATIARPFVAVGFGSVWSTETHGIVDAWKTTSHKSEALALKAKTGDAHFDSRHFAVVEVR